MKKFFWNMKKRVERRKKEKREGAKQSSRRGV